MKSKVEGAVVRWNRKVAEQERVRKKDKERKKAMQDKINMIKGVDSEFYGDDDVKN